MSNPRSTATLPTLTAAAVCLPLLWPTSGWAQSAPAPLPVPVPGDAAAPPTAKPSASHIFAKTVTLNAGYLLTTLTIFSVGTGDPVATGLLTTGVMAIGVTAYPLNEYLWDRFSPPTLASTASGSFDAAASAWRTTEKYVTFKAAVLTAKFAWVYAYTGSAAATLALGTATSLALPAVFYVNSMGWDWYDWYQAQPAQATPPKAKVTGS